MRWGEGEGGSGGGGEGWRGSTILPSARFPPMNRGLGNSWLLPRTSYGKSNTLMPPGPETRREGVATWPKLPAGQQSGPPVGPGSGHQGGGGGLAPPGFVAAARGDRALHPAPRQ